MWIEPRSTFIVSFPPGLTEKLFVIRSGSALAETTPAASNSVVTNSFE